MSSIKRSGIISNLTSTIKDQDEFLTTLKLLNDGCQEIESFQHEYDYQPDHPGNGFRSLVKTINKYFDRVNQLKKLNGSLLRDYVVIGNTLVKSVILVMLVREKGVNFDPTDMSDLDMEFFTKLFNTGKEDIQPLVGQISFFNLKGGLDIFLKRVFFFLHFSITSLWSKVKMICSPKYARNLMTHGSVSMNLRTAQSLTPEGIYMLGVKAMNRLDTRSTRVQRIKVASNNEWLLSVPDQRSPAVLVNKPHRSVMTSSVLITPNNVEKGNKKILLYIHGGGFIAVTAEMTTGIMSRTVKQLKVPVLIPDYRKIPDHKFPSSLQDVFDVYMFLSSGGSEVIQRIGFVPEEIVICGDSAGGHMTLGLTLVLNRLRKMGVGVRMPVSLAIQYPCAVPCFLAVPSYALIPLDAVLGVGFVGLVASFFAPLDPPLTDDQWYTKKDGTVERTIKRFDHRLKDPLFNLLAAPGDVFEDLKDIPLFVLACEMDPILDHSVMIASKWRGRVQLDIVPDMPHGFVSYYLYGGVKNELQVYYEQMRQAVQCAPLTSNNNNSNC